MKLIYLEKINSTNTYAKEHINEFEDKTVIYTHNQTNGRGRFDRKWVDLGSENIFMSIVLKPSTTLQKVYSNLTQYTSLALAKTFDSYGVIPKIKWPNDILINGKKISGILAETVFKNNALQGIVIGVGINLNANEKDFKKIDKAVTSLNLELKKNIDKKEFLNKFLEKFFNSYDEFLHRGFQFIKEDYINHIDFLGKEISITNLEKTYTGIAKNITDDGAIIINNKEFYTGDIL